MTQTIQPRAGDVDSNTSQVQTGTMDTRGRPRTWWVVWTESNEDDGEYWDQVLLKQKEKAWHQPTVAT